MLTKYINDPYLLYYQAKYMFRLMAVHEALIMVNSIIQYNQYEIWKLAAEIHAELKNYSEVLVCLNHASRLAFKGSKTSNPNLEAIYSEFSGLGKIKNLTPFDEITCRPKMMVVSDNPAAILNLVE